ncbi:MAG: [protein-PII] uridylyltransferase [Rhodobacteraceae bacterium TMED111]|nr:[protein-PII] uridylyltransferase [Marinovum sp.]OUV41549.1 MAG: [protein-PII] uridylyltransferase [Rhodobacteraceae bacterium TMED111]
MTQLPDSLDSDPIKSGKDKPAYNDEDLICESSQIFDQGKVNDFFNLKVSERGKLVSLLKELKSKGFDRISFELRKNPLKARKAIRSYAFLTDRLVTSAWKFATEIQFPSHNPTEAEKLSIISVGGYGRREMAPFSDVDLLFLTPYKITPWSENVIETVLYLLWDLKLKVGHSSRSIKDCLRLGSDDYTIRTAMLEHRFVCGDINLASQLNEKLWKNLFSGTAKDFISAKLIERENRHEKHGQRYMVEPNVKEGKGGLRDLQSLYWIAKYVYQTQNISNLVDLNVFRSDEYLQFEQAEEFLWAVRCQMHHLADRAIEQLSFDLQVEVASAMGYHDSRDQRAVEIFMQDYFRHATRVGDLTRIFLTSLEAVHAKDEPLLERIFKRKPKINNNYLVIQNRLAIKSEKEFLTNPINLLKLFSEALRTGLLIHPNAMRLVSANLAMVNNEFRASTEAQQIFLELLLKHGNPERALRRMNELGFLAKFIPEFEPIVAMMQFNMYHSYTVDEHTIQCLKTLAQIEKGELVEELPIASSILKDGVNRKVIYIALLLHDIGKGRSDDHSILGAKIAKQVSPRLGLNKQETETVEWLVRYHLLMSDMAQKRDISDPRTVRDFAKAVQSVKRLNLLTVLTVCDVRSVGPDTWNNWKATLIRQLYAETKAILEQGAEALNRENRMTEAKKALREKLSEWDNKDIKIETGRHYPPYWQGFQLDAQFTFAKLLRNLGADEIKIELTPDTDRDATRICFALSDHPGIFSRLAGALALVGANVVDARSYTSKDGFATAAFWIQDGDGSPYNQARFSRLRRMIEKTLSGEVITREAIKERDKFKKREKAFKVPTSITFDNEGSEIYTIIEVDTRDRPGLLFDLTRTLANMNVYIASAVIATYGEQVVDSFYVKDMFGLKFHSESKQKKLEQNLRQAITLGVERAES